MRIAILGVGNIGATLTQRLSAAGHQVKVANSRGPETISADVLADGGQAVQAADVATEVDALILSIPLSRIPDVRPVVDRLPADAVVLDTSNYYPMRDGHIAALDEGQVESEWVAEQLGRPVVKAWNAILAGSFTDKATRASSPDRIAIPVAADSDHDRDLGISLVEHTGFTGYDAGTLAESWRQQPGAPAYCTELDAHALEQALAAAEKDKAPANRDRIMQQLSQLAGGPTRDEMVAINRNAHR